MSDPGCVSADTEYLTPLGWKRFDAYIIGDQVAQFWPDTRDIDFVAPRAYVKLPCHEMVAIAPCRGTSQRLSPEHRVLYYKKNGSWGECSASQFVKDLHRVGAAHLQRKFATTFSVRSASSLDLSDAAIRLMVAVIADGHFPPNKCVVPKCTIRIKKQRKILRLRELLNDAAIPYTERQCGGAPGFQVFRFYAPRNDKIFAAYYWGASQHQLEIIASELPHWDSAIDPRPSAGCRFSSYVERSADFAQYAFSAAKRSAVKSTCVRERRGTIETEYTVQVTKGAKDAGPGRESAVRYAPNPEGFKYCFETPSSFLLLRYNGYIFATGNTGKTRVAIELFKPRILATKKPVIVLGPKTSLRSAWANDLKKFAPELRWSIAYAENRERAFDIPADFYITNHDASKWLAKQSPKFLSRFCGLIVDESGAYKHHTSQRSKAIAKIRPNFEFCHLLNGTPNPNTILDLWHQAYLLDQGARLGKSFYAFRNSACIPRQNGFGVEWVDRKDIELIVAALLRDIVIRHKVEDCVDLPENNEYVVPFSMAPAQERAYKSMRACMLAELGSGNISATSASAVATKLLQIASGAVYEDEFRYHVIDDSRTELVMDLLEPRQHSLVFFLWKHQKDQLIAAAEARGFTYCVVDGEVSQKQREKNIELFEQGFYKIAFLQPQSAAHSLTLVRANTSIWVSPTPNAEHFLQGNKRMDRIGQTQKMETIVILAEDTIDERMYYDLLGPKRLKLNTLLEEMRAEK